MQTMARRRLNTALLMVFWLVSATALMINAPRLRRIWFCYRLAHKISRIGARPLQARFDVLPYAPVAMANSPDRDLLSRHSAAMIGNAPGAGTCAWGDLLAGRNEAAIAWLQRADNKN